MAHVCVCVWCACVYRYPQAGLLLDPFFSSSLPMELNVAAYGMVIGHVSDGRAHTHIHTHRAHIHTHRAHIHTHRVHTQGVYTHTYRVHTHVHCSWPCMGARVCTVPTILDLDSSVCVRVRMSVS